MNEAFRKWWAGSCQHLYGKHAAWEAWQEATPQWQPIETAPNDGTEIWLFEKNWADKPFIGRWVDASNTFADRELKIGVDPTHWQPLPEPPKS